MYSCPAVIILTSVHLSDLNRTVFFFFLFFSISPAVILCDVQRHMVLTKNSVSTADCLSHNKDKCLKCLRTSGSHRQGSALKKPGIKESPSPNYYPRIILAISPLDIIPTKFLLEVLDSVAPCLLSLINSSFLLDVFPIILRLPVSSYMSKTVTNNWKCTS